MKKYFCKTLILFAVLLSAGACKKEYILPADEASVTVADTADQGNLLIQEETSVAPAAGTGE